MSALPLVQDDHRPLQQLRRVRSHRCLSTDSQSAYLQNPEKRGKNFRVREEPLARLGQGEFCLVQVKVSWFLSLLKKYFRYFIFLDALASLRSILFSQSVSESVTFSDY